MVIRCAIAATAMLLCGATAVMAAPVTYSTSGSFNGGGTSVVFGGGADTLTITYLPIAATVDADPSTFASFGTFQTTATGAGAAITPGSVFDLTITQTVPSVGSGVTSATLSGQIRPDSSSGLADFHINSVTIGGVVYSVVNNPLPLVPPSTNNGLTTIQGLILIPEPASLGLLGTAGLLALRRRR